MKRSLISLFTLSLVVIFSAFAAAADLQGKKVLFIDSYHEGYDWSDGITNGIKQVFDGKGIELKIVRMDTKRNGDEEFKKQAGEKAKAAIEELKPDVVIAADDNASKYVIVQYFKDSSLPFVFCGVNWDASVYGFPWKNVTGMLEVSPIPQLIEQLKPFAKGGRIGFLGPDNETARKEAEAYKKVFGMQLVEHFAKDYDDWKKGFEALQSSADMLIIESDGGLYKDKAADMKAYAEANSKIPSGTAYDFMTPVAMIGFAKIAEEQGAWAADAALKILGGAEPSSISVAKNKEGKLIINTRIAKTLNANLSYDLIQSAAQVIE
ncbi:MAG: ABC transporter substrate-binding protein [Syntrophobacteraceae bacterium]